MRDSGLDKKHITLTARRWLNALFAVLILFGLYLTKHYSYILFHGLAELFSIIISCGIFILVWNTRRFLTNSYFLLIGIAYLFVGFIDTIHTFAYKGMGIFEGYDSNLPTQLWIAARYVESITLLVAPFFTVRKLKAGQAFLAYSLAVFLLLFTIFYRIFPDCFIEGQGLTVFKVSSEYIISAILSVSLVFLYQKRRYFDLSIIKLLTASAITVIASEMSFTLYADVYGFFNMLGHILKIVSFYLMYRAIIVISLDKPYSMLFRDLSKEREKAQQYLDVAGVVFVAIDPDQKVMLINRKGCEILGYEEHEVVGKNWFDTFLSDKAKDEVKAVFKKLMAGEIEAVEYVENLIVTKSGEEKIIAWHNTTLVDENGYITGILSSGENVTYRKRAEERLEQSNVLLGKVGRMAKVGGWEVDAKTLGLTWTEETGRIYELPPGYTPPLEDGINYFHPDDRTKLKEAVGRALENGEPYDMEIRLMTAKGNQIWARTICHPQRVDGETVKLLGIFQDITERKLADDRIRSLLSDKELLLKEVHHRIKNNMLTIMSLLLMQSDALNDPSVTAALGDARNRVRSMMVLYDKLYRSVDFTEASAKGYLTPLIDGIAGIFPNRGQVSIKARIDDIILDAKTLLHLGIIVNELITNTMKYAFAGRDNGKILVSFSTKDDHITLVIEDDGTGIAEPDRPDHNRRSTDMAASSGFGLQLVGMLAQQLEGTVDTKSSSQGTSFTITFPYEGGASG